MLWYALLIPCVLAILAFIIWNKQIIWQEMIVPVAVSLIFILISYFSIKYASMKDVEYNGYTIVEARYYEYWETWVNKTCSYTTTHSCGKNCTYTTVHYYDCSYCDHNPEHYEAIDNAGHTFDISKAKYQSLIKKWSAVPKFNELNRNINHHNGCGKDGDMYSINWNGKVESSECSVFEVPFENIVKVSHSAFQYPNISDESADSLKLFHYPEIYDYYKQRSILGLEYLGYPSYKRDSIQTKFEFINGNLGPKNKVKLFILIFKNKPIDIAFKQEAYWDGGNQNELVVCIGVNNRGAIDWVKPFSWCDNKRIIVDTREDIASQKIFNADSIYYVCNNNIQKYFHYKDFKDFNYLTFEPTMGQILFVYIGTLIVSLLSLWWCVKNEIDNTWNSQY